eukprot:2380467-Pleurochrysis_carterae.AAC.2
MPSHVASVSIKRVHGMMDSRQQIFNTDSDRPFATKRCTISPACAPPPWRLARASRWRSSAGWSRGRSRAHAPATRAIVSPLGREKSFQVYVRVSASAPISAGRNA